MPARSVSTWKLSARSALTTPSRNALAISQPTSSMPSAIASRGRKAPICSRKPRSGSSMTSMFCMVVSLVIRAPMPTSAAMPASGTPTQSGRLSIS